MEGNREISGLVEKATRQQTELLSYLREDSWQGPDRVDGPTQNDEARGGGNTAADRHRRSRSSTVDRGERALSQEPVKLLIAGASPDAVNLNSPLRGHVARAFERLLPAGRI